MNKVLLALLCLFVFAGCTEKTAKVERKNPKKKIAEPEWHERTNSSFEYVSPGHWSYAEVERIPYDLNVKPTKEMVANRTDEKLWDLGLHIQRDYRQEQQLNKCISRDKHETWLKCKARLLALAKSKFLDAKSLELCLNKIQPKPDSFIVLAPIGAYAAHMGKEDIWIIVCRWECEGGKNIHLPLCHIRHWAFTMKEGIQVAYHTCD